MFGQMTPEDQAQLSMAMRLLGGSGPSTTPVGFGQALGNAGLGAMGDYNSLIAAALERKQAEKMMDLRERQMKQEYDMQSMGMDLRKQELDYSMGQAEAKRADSQAQSKAFEAYKGAGLGSPLASLAMEQKTPFTPYQQAGLAMAANAPDIASYQKGIGQVYPEPSKPEAYSFQTLGNDVYAVKPTNPNDRFPIGPARPDKTILEKESKSVEHGFRISDDLARDIKPLEEMNRKIKYIQAILPNWRDPATSLNLKEAMSNLTETGSRAQAEVMAWQGGQFGNLSQRIIGKLTRFLSGRYTEDSVKQIQDLVNQLDSELVSPSMELTIRGHQQRAQSIGANVDAAIPGQYQARLKAGQEKAQIKPTRRFQEKPVGATDKDWAEYLQLTGGE